MKLKKLVSLLSLPNEIIYNLPYITVTGTESLIIENYISIIEYTKNKIRIKTSCGVLAVSGEELMLKEISESEIAVRGKILKWEYI